MRFGLLTLVALGIAVSGGAAPASAQTIFADTVIDYRSSGAGPMQEPYGGDERINPRSPVRLRDLSNTIDRDRYTAVSLPTGASITLGFSNGVIFDGPDDDIFISELSNASELANVFVSTDFGRTFTFLGTADGGKVTRLDLRTINFAGRVNAVKVVGLDARGSWPGFDLAYIEGLEGSIQMSGAAAAESAEGSGSLVDLIDSGGQASENVGADVSPPPSNVGGGSLTDLLRGSD